MSAGRPASPGPADLCRVLQRPYNQGLYKPVQKIPSKMKLKTKNSISMWNLVVQGTRLNDSDILSLMTGQALGNLSAVFGEHGSPGGGGGEGSRVLEPQCSPAAQLH